MTEEQVKIDALLKTTFSRLLQAAESTNRLRIGYLEWNIAESRKAALSLATHMEVVESTLRDSSHLMKIQDAAIQALHTQSGGLVN